MRKNFILFEYVFEEGLPKKGEKITRFGGFTFTGQNIDMNRTCVLY